VHNLGEKIKTLRKQARLTLKSLAQKSNISISYLCDIEKGRSNPSLETLESIAAALKVPPSALLYGDIPLVAEDTASLNLIKVPLLKQAILHQPLLVPQNIERFLFISMDDLTDQENLSFFRVNDDAMIGSRLLRGELALVNLDAKVRQGDLALVGFEKKEACIRRVHFLQNQTVLDTGHPGVKPEIVDKDGGARILGKVIRAIINFA
jgi:transcriptional regulator with XRE-family HTH domain